MGDESILAFYCTFKVNWPESVTDSRGLQLFTIAACRQVSLLCSETKCHRFHLGNRLQSHHLRSIIVREMIA